MNRLPNFLYIGPDKAGSTWLYDVLAWHPNICVPPAKDIMYFDRYYEKGHDWYTSKFNCNSEKVVGEICHNYLYSEDAALRIEDDLDNYKLMVNLREPVSRAFSAYLYLLKHDLYDGSFEQALDDVDDLLEHGRYHKYLEMYNNIVGDSRMFVCLFDDLKADSKKFAKEIFSEVSVEPLALPSELKGKSLPASKARSKGIAKLAKRAAWFFRDLGLPNLVGSIKRSDLIKRLLYRSYDNKPTPNKKVEKKLKKRFAPTVARLDDKYDYEISKRWGYEEIL